jgi:hypothetical protein
MLSELDLSNVAGAEDLVSAADKDKLLHDARKRTTSSLTRNVSGAEAGTESHSGRDIGRSLFESASAWHCAEYLGGDEIFAL